MSDYNNGFFEFSHLVSPFDHDFYVFEFEGYETFTEAEESHFNSTQHHHHVSSSSFDSSQHQQTQHHSTSFHDSNADQCFCSCEELMRNENKTTKSRIVSKTRIKWTEELHLKFIDCVDQLGGAQKATPKQLLHLMNTKGLTLVHIKSHLQKYRTSQQIRGKYETKLKKKELLQPNQNIRGKQLMEAVRQQIDTQSSLNEQLEVQKNLISSIEEQMKQLRGILELRKPIELRNEEEGK